MIASRPIPDARLLTLAAQGADLARLTTRPAPEQPAALGAGAEHAAHDGGQQLGRGGAGGVGHARQGGHGVSEEESR